MSDEKRPEPKKPPGKDRKQAKEAGSRGERLALQYQRGGLVYDGPLDLLLDLIRKQDIDIYDIPIGRITAQFLAYVEGLKQTEVDAAADFIYVASLLIHIKSRMLLPRAPAEGVEGEQEDPRRELVERLLEHERFKNAAQMLLQKQQIEAATWTNPAIRQFRLELGEGAGNCGRHRRPGARLPRDSRPCPAKAGARRGRGSRDRLPDARLRPPKADHGRSRPVSLSSLLKNTRSERALICMFLALLELVRLQADFAAARE